MYVIPTYDSRIAYVNLRSRLIMSYISRCHTNVTYFCAHSNPCILESFRIHLRNATILVHMSTCYANPNHPNYNVEWQ